jgi:hypothetical protein
MAGMAKIIQRSEVKLTEEENQLLFDSGELAMELLKLPTAPPSPATPGGYVLMGPEGMPTFPEPYPTLHELACATARYMLRFQQQGYYTDMRMVRQPLEWVADNLSVQTVPVVMSATAAYTKYVNDNLERIGRDGWVPISYAEFLDSEECTNEMYREEVSRPADDQDGWTFVGNAAVDAGMLMITDPCYINSEWKKDGKERPMVAPGYRHTDGTVLFFPGHGAAPVEGALPFEHYEAIVEKYGKTVNAMNAEGILTKLPTPAPSGEFSYTGACEATGDHNELQGGQLKFKMGHAGAGVVFRTGYGDGCYPVYLRYVHDGEWGTRVAEARVVFIDPSELDEDDTYQESDTEWDEGEPAEEEAK